jgi:hypothetical protein
LALALETVLSAGAEGFQFDQDYVVARLEDAGLTAGDKSKRGPRKRAERAGKIELLVGALEDPWWAARDHARSTQERTGTPALLPRPTQKWLAAATGLTESDVSRCLQDPRAKSLRVLWDGALDLVQILKWTGKRRRRRA